MNLSTQILFFFGVLGVFNALLISIYFVLPKKVKHISNLFFGLFLFALCIRIFKSIFYYFHSVEVGFFIKSGFLTCIFIGPFLYLYIKSKYYKQHIKNWRYQIAFWVSLNFCIHYFYPFHKNVVLWKTYITTLIELQWLFYLITSSFVLRNSFRKIFKKKDNNSILENWLIILLVSVFIIWVVFFFVNFEHFIAGSIVFSILFYSILIYFLLHRKVFSNIFIFNEKYEGKKIELSKASKLINKIDVLMKFDKIFTNSNLQTSDVAKMLNISTHQFSQLLNDNLNKSFSTFINEHRIDEAKLKIKSNQNYTLEAIGNESGFNSKSTFFTTFKKLVGLTPSEYKKKISSDL